MGIITDNLGISRNIVVDQAKVSCSCSKNTTRLNVEENQDGSNVVEPFIVATARDCIAGVNLQPFKRCYSTDFVSAAKVYIDGVQGNEDLYLKYRSDYADRGYGTCLHLLEEVWFESNEKVVVNNMYGMEERLLDLAGRLGDVYFFKNKTEVLKEDIQGVIKEQKNNEYCSSLEIFRRNKKRQDTLDKKIKDILDTRIPKIEEIGVKFGYAEVYALKSPEFKQNFTLLKAQALGIQNHINAFASESTWEIGEIDRTPVHQPSNATRADAESPEITAAKIVDDVKSFESYKEIKERIDELVAEIKKIEDSIDEWVSRSSNTLVKNSFMVCRCGGCLEFATTGQEYVYYFETLYARTLDFILAIKNRYQELAETEPFEYGIEDDMQLKYAYEDAVVGLGEFYDLLLTGEEKQEEMASNIHIEFIAKSVQDEVNQYLTGLITFGSVIPGVVGLGCGRACVLMAVWAIGNHFLEKVLTVEDGRMAVEAGLTEAGIYKTITDSKSPALAVMANLSNILSVFAALTSLNFDIEDNWLEKVRIYVFTKNYMFYSQQKLKSDGENDGDPEYWRPVDRIEYLSVRRGDNVEWGEDPGATFDVKTRFGEDNSKEDISTISDFDEIFRGERAYE